MTCSTLNRSSWIALALTVASCTPAGWQTYRDGLPSDKRAFMEKVDNLGPTAKVAPKDLEAAWKRAEDFLNQHAGGFESEPGRSFYAKSKGGSYAYAIDAKKFMDDYSISVVCTHATEGASEAAWRNARIAKYYIATGELPFPDLISK